MLRRGKLLSNTGVFNTSLSQHQSITAPELKLGIHHNMHLQHATMRKTGHWDWTHFDINCACLWKGLRHIIYHFTLHTHILLLHSYCRYCYQSAISCQDSWNTLHYSRLCYSTRRFKERQEGLDVSYTNTNAKERNCASTPDATTCRVLLHTSEFQRTTAARRWCRRLVHRFWSAS